MAVSAWFRGAKPLLRLTSVGEAAIGRGAVRDRLRHTPLLSPAPRASTTTAGRALITATGSRASSAVALDGNVGSRIATFPGGFHHKWESQPPLHGSHYSLRTHVRHLANDRGESMEGERSAIGRFGKFVPDFLKYGSAFAISYASVYVLMGGSLYVGMQSGAFMGVDALYILNKLGFEGISLNPALGNLFMAFAINECLDLVRVPIATVLTPRVARLIGSFGKSKAKTPSAEAAPQVQKPQALLRTSSSKHDLIQKYGMTFVMWWGFLWVVSWSTIYLSLSNGLIMDVDAAAIFSYLEDIIPLHDLGLDMTRMDPSVANVVLAFGLNETIEWPRFALAGATTPFIQKFVLRR